jgi:hypothetical protein
MPVGHIALLPCSLCANILSTEVIFSFYCCVCCKKAKDVNLGSPGDADITIIQKKIKKCLWFISISRNTIIVLVSAVTAFFFERGGVSPFILSGMKRQ